MNKIILVLFFVTLSYGQYPAVYSSLGDKIYSNAPKIKELKNYKEYVRYISRIQNYIDEVEKTKEQGFKIEQGDSSVDPKEYLQKLRELSDVNNFFVQDTYANYKASMKDGDHLLFSNLINSGLIDIHKHKAEILEHYTIHKNEIELKGVLQELLEERKAFEALQEQKRKKQYQTNKEPEAHKIQRLRQKDKEKEQMLQQELEKELQEKKRKILEEQMRELSR